MIELTPSAQNRLDDYLNEMRRVLTGSPSVDLADVERDIRDHIDAALAGQAAPVEALVLDNVLQSLGKPSQWLPEAETAWYRRSPSTWPAASKQLLRVGQRLAGGPERYRLAYLSLLVLGLGWYLMPSGRLDKAIIGPMIATLVSFILSRASLALFSGPIVGRSEMAPLSGLVGRLPAGRRVLFLGPVAIVGLSGIKNENDFKAASQGEPPHKLVQRGAALHELEKRPRDTKMWNVSLNPIKVACGLTAVAGGSWSLIGLLWHCFPAWFASSFTPS